MKVVCHSCIYHDKCSGAVCLLQLVSVGNDKREDLRELCVLPFKGPYYEKVFMLLERHLVSVNDI